MSKSRICGLFIWHYFSLSTWLSTAHHTHTQPSRRKNRPRRCNINRGKIDRAAETERVQSTDKERGACWNLNTWSTSKLVRGTVGSLISGEWLGLWKADCRQICVTSRTLKLSHTHTLTEDILHDFISLLTTMYLSAWHWKRQVFCSFLHILPIIAKDFHYSDVRLRSRRWRKGQSSRWQCLWMPTAIKQKKMGHMTGEVLLLFALIMYLILHKSTRQVLFICDPLTSNELRIQTRRQQSLVIGLLPPRQTNTTLYLLVPAVFLTHITAIAAFPPEIS